MQKRIIALAILASITTAASAGGVPSSTPWSSTSAGASTNSASFASSAGNGSAVSFGSAWQAAGASAGSDSGTWKNKDGTRFGSAEAAGGTFAVGGAASGTVTSGNAWGLSKAGGEACAAAGAGASFRGHGITGAASGFANSRNSNSVATSSWGNGAAHQWASSGNVSEFSAGVGALRNGDALNKVTSETHAGSESWRDGGGSATGNGWRHGTSSNFGNAGALANARAGNVCTPPGCPK